MLEKNNRLTLLSLVKDTGYTVQVLLYTYSYPYPFHILLYSEMRIKKGLFLEFLFQLKFA